MKILFLGNNWVGWKVLSWLVEQQEDIVGLVLHPEDKIKYGEEIIGCSNIDKSQIFDGSRLRQKETISAIKHLKPDIGLSILFGYILKPEFIDLFPKGIINLHPSYLPYDKGQYPNVWSIIEKTPAGATLHYIDKDIDTGDIIAQKEIETEAIDTGESLYKKLEILCLNIFIENWPKIKLDKIERKSQDSNKGTYHSSKDVKNIDIIDLNKEYKAGELIDIIRARTFPPYEGAYFIESGRKIYLRMNLLYEEQLNLSNSDYEKPEGKDSLLNRCYGTNR